MELDWGFFAWLLFLITNFTLGIIALRIKSKIIFNYWPKRVETEDYDQEAVLDRKERTRKFFGNVLFGFFVIWPALYSKFMYDNCCSSESSEE